MPVVNSEVWKWISGVLVSVVIAMIVYIWSIENVIKAAVTDEISAAMSANLEPLRIRVRTLEDRYNEAREERVDTARRTTRLEAALPSIDARLDNISKTQTRILNTLERLD